MSIELWVFTRRESVPSRAQWNSALHTHGFDVILSDSEPFKQSGYWPVMVNGNRSGFEFSLARYSADFLQNDDLTEAVEDRSYVATFRFSREVESEAAQRAALVFAELSHGVFYDESEDRSICGQFEIEDEIESLKPSYWLNQDPGLDPVKEKRRPVLGKMLAKDRVAALHKLSDDWSRANLPMPASLADARIEGVPLLTLTMLPELVVKNLTSQPFSFKPVIRLGQSIKAIDRVTPHVDSEQRESLFQLRKLCESLVDCLGFQITG